MGFRGFNIVLGEASTFNLPMSSQYETLTIVPTWVSWPSRVPKIAILMTHFITEKTNQIY
jgi:hypothetical protein